MTRTENGGRSGYHHGDLRNALVEAATDLARDGGPEAVVLRAAARRVGVSPTAAYRHFAGQADLLNAVKERGQRWLAETMERTAGETGGGEDAGRAAEERVKALGRGYVAFALAEPGLFRTAFRHDPAAAGAPSGAAPAAGDPDGWAFRSFRLLVGALDALVDTGRMPAERRPGAEITAWSAVHGLAVLLLDGPLSRVAPEQREALVEGALSTVIGGLTAPE
ncbi:TetR/AcrR family transcriptional regulator [Streptomyces sp. DH37]|uniref:TetR/AcrR family transcriptional regulator n=1 Tax=Streptomyces sp. DH37 TaxID=3040122 RepID=UPI002441D8C1|nr:TetR/AcrR family transcriptional regulator [Streptomyces sp. DH37]MDG9701309.1 TetR/AcrR family transcriptional regulator [Streptomyces sp. DH37]